MVFYEKEADPFYNEIFYDSDGFDQDGFNNKGFEKDGYGGNGFDREGFHRYKYWTDIEKKLKRANRRETWKRLAKKQFQKLR